MKPLEPDSDPMGSWQPEGVQLYQERSLLALLVAISLSTPVITLGVYLRDGLTALAWVGMLLSVLMWGLLALYLLGWRRHLPGLLVYLLVLISAAAVAAHGTVRSMAALAMLGAIVGAGVFLSRRNMIGSAVLGVVLLAVLNWAEGQGLLPTPSNKTGWAVWVAQTLVLVSLVVTVNFGRRRLLQSFRDQHQALALANQAQLELKASETRVSALFNNNPVASLVQSVERNAITDCNAAFCELFGYRREALLGRDMPVLWADAGDMLEYESKLKATRRVHAMSANGRREDGSTFAAMVYAEVVRHGDEHLVITLVLDVSAEKASRIELEKSRERFSKAFSFSPLGMSITRLSDGRFMEVNPANERVLGYNQNDFLGKTALEAGVWISEQDRDRFVDSLRSQGRLVGYDTRMRAKNGEVVDVKIWAEMIELEGEACALSFSLNVAEEKRREAMLLNVAEGVSGETGAPFFRSLAQHLARAIGADGVMIGELNEFRRLQTVAQLWDGALQPDAEHDLSFTLCEQALAQPDMLLVEHTPPRRLSLLPPMRDAELSQFIGLPLRDADGSAVGLLTVAWRQRPHMQGDLQALLTIFASRCNAELMRLRRDREIGQLQATLEQRVHERTEQLQYLNRELDAFAYTVSHDLKSPLRAIDGFMHLLQEQMTGRLQPDDEDLVQRVLASAARMNSLITDLLSLARLSQGQLQRMQVNLSDLAEGVVRQERHRDPSREIVVQIAPGMSAHCDPRLAQVVLENLMGNAWKYTRQQSQPRIELGLAPSAAGEPPNFFIRDNGAGFDMARSDRLFKPFNRLHTAQQFEGTGIGLATVRRIIERHGGQIHAKAAVGEGATFWFGFGRPGAGD